MANLLGGLLGNYSEVPVQELAKQYGGFLIPNETIQMGFKLIRDTFILTYERLIFIDHPFIRIRFTKSRWKPPAPALITAS